MATRASLVPPVLKPHEYLSRIDVVRSGSSMSSSHLNLLSLQCSVQGAFRPVAERLRFQARASRFTFYNVSVHFEQPSQCSVVSNSAGCTAKESRNLSDGDKLKKQALYGRWHSFRQNRSTVVSAIFTRRGEEMGTSGPTGEPEEEEGTSGKTAYIPSDQWQQEAEDPEAAVPYIPEVQDEVSVEESFLQEFSAKGSTAIRVENLTKIVKDQKTGDPKPAVQNVTLDVEAGKLVSLVGTSGSGKTTLLNMIAGLLEPTSGAVYFDGQDMSDVVVQDRDVGMLFQSYALFKHMTVLDNITYGLRTRKRRGQLSQEAIAKRGQDLLKLVQLTELGNRYPSQLSGGQRQRVALARALCTLPRVLLLDEPFGALDAIVRLELRSWVRNLQRKLRITTIMVTHDQEEALEMSDFMVVLHSAEVKQMGPPFEVFRRPNSAFVMNFVCDPNILPAKSLAVLRSGLRTDKPKVLVKPDDVVIFLEEQRHLNTVPATVTNIVNMGSEVEMTVTFDDNKTFEFIKPRYDWVAKSYETGQRLHLQFRPMLMMPATDEECPTYDSLEEYQTRSRA